MHVGLDSVAERATPFFMIKAAKIGAWELGRQGKPVVFEKFLGGFSPWPPGHIVTFNPTLSFQGFQLQGQELTFETEDRAL